MIFIMAVHESITCLRIDTEMDGFHSLIIKLQRVECGKYV